MSYLTISYQGYIHTKILGYFEFQDGRHTIILSLKKYFSDFKYMHGGHLEIENILIFCVYISLVRIWSDLTYDIDTLTTLICAYK